MLLEKGANPYAESKFFGTPLAAAALKYDTDPEALKSLLEVCPDAVHKPKQIPGMIKMMARATGLFAAGGNVKFGGMSRMMREVKSQKGRTPIHLASERGDVAMVKTMLAASPPPSLATGAKVPSPDEIAAKKFAPHLVTVDRIKSVLNSGQRPASMPDNPTALFDSTELIQTV